MKSVGKRRSIPVRRGDEGFALVLTLLVVLVIGVLATGAVVVGGNHLLVNRYYERGSVLDTAAEGGLELARATINGDPTLYPDDGFVVLENGVQVRDHNNVPIPGVRRWLYAGPTGVTTGQYGVFGSIVSVVRDDGGGVAIRRSQVFQESFARYAYFTDVEPSNIFFGGGDQIFGPLHSNDHVKIHSTGATFHGEVRTHRTVQGQGFGTFMQGYEENVSYIPMPETQDLNRLRTHAQQGGTHFISNTNGAEGGATLRIDFVAIDTDGDGSVTGDNEGFFRVYRSNNWRYVTAKMPQSGGMTNSPNCGRYDVPGGTFSPVTEFGQPGTGYFSQSRTAVLATATRRCWLGGADELHNGFQPVDAFGEWLPWTGPIHASVAGRPDAAYLFPLSRALNPEFKGVIFVDGKVAISGRLRGRVTLASNHNIVIADNIRYATDPGAGTCQDILGLFSGRNVVVSDNLITAPQQPGPGNNWFSYKPDTDEFIHAVVLALQNFTAENFNTGATTAERCEGTQWGRGCLYLTGGIIQTTRGAVGTTAGTGYLKRYSYDTCAASNPPPYFPTTGHFARGQHYQVDPANFSVAQYYDLLTPES